MIALTFENEHGKIEIGLNKSWKLIETSGLGLPGKTHNVTTYPKVPGQKTLSSIHTARHITLKCDVDVSAGIRAELAMAARILDKPGTLTVTIGEESYKISCYCNEFQPGERNKVYHPVVLQFTCDSPYFQDIEISRHWIFRNTGLIEDTFTLPCIWSERISRTNIPNAGDVETEPIITVYGAGAADIDLEIKNHTTGHHILLESIPELDGYITIDIPNRRIYNDNGDNLLSYMSNDTFLNDFLLAVGENDIEVLYVGTDISAVCEFYNQYIEAVI